MGFEWWFLVVGTRLGHEPLALAIDGDDGLALFQLNGQLAAALGGPGLSGGGGLLLGLEFLVLAGLGLHRWGCVGVGWLLFVGGGGRGEVKKVSPPTPTTPPAPLSILPSLHSLATAAFA